jgi:hypothetical protein
MSGAFSLASLRHVVDQASPRVRRDIARIYSVLIGFNRRVGRRIRTVLPAAVAVRHGASRILLRTAGVRSRPGFFFSLGHSTIVLALTVAIAVAAAYVKRDLPQL